MKLNPMSDDFHVIPTPELKQAADDCPLLERDLEGWIVCCSRRFFPLARRVAGDDSLAEDVLQTSWLKILQSIGHAHFDKPKACPWVRTIVHNTAEDMRRIHSGEVELETLWVPGETPETLAQKREMLILLREMVKLLPETYRQVLELHTAEGLSNQQIACRLHISRSNVSTRLNRAVRLLKTLIEKSL
jgi:RNA polymerase sigma-70 factor (ECF subfamily)